jgi:hypothetical protein
MNTHGNRANNGGRRHYPDEKLRESNEFGTLSHNSIDLVKPPVLHLSRKLLF